VLRRELVLRSVPGRAQIRPSDHAHDLALEFRSDGGETPAERLHAFVFDPRAELLVGARVVIHGHLRLAGVFALLRPELAASPPQAFRSWASPVAVGRPVA